MSGIHYNGRIFRSFSNTSEGEADTRTTFRYHQKGDIVWAEYAGGRIRFGQLVGLVLPDSKLEIRYQHVNESGELMTGLCLSTPEVLPDGRLRLYESWQWTCGDRASGESIVEEILVL
jgi:hypothetical protein